MAAPLSYIELFDDATLWADPIDQLAWHAATNPNAAAAARTTPEVLQNLYTHTYTRTNPILVAFMDDSAPGLITIGHSPTPIIPRLGAPAHALDGTMYFKLGNAELDIVPLHVSDTDMFDRVLKIVHTDHADTLADLQAGGAGNQLGHLVPGAGVDPATYVRKSCLIPHDLVHAIMADNQIHYSPVEFWTRFMATPAATAGWAATNANLITWWKAAATFSDDGHGHGLDDMAVTLPQPAGHSRTRLQAQLRRDVVRELAPLGRARALAGLPAVSTAIDTLRADVNALSTVRETNEDTRRNIDRARREAEKTFTGRHGAGVAALLYRYTDVATDEDLPVIHRTLASYKEKSRDMTTINLALFSRGDAVPASNEINLPKATTHMVNLFRTHNIMGIGLEFGEGMNPFSIACQGHVQSREVVELAEKQASMESGDTSITLADAALFQTKDARFPRDVNQAVDKLWGFSVLVDVYFGAGHPYALALAGALPALCPLIVNINTIHAGDPAYVLTIAIRIMLWIQQSLNLYLRGRRLAPPGTVVPLPDFDAMMDELRMQMYDSKLPKIPRTWTSILTLQVPDVFKTSSPGEDTPRIRGGGRGGADEPSQNRAPVQNPFPNTKLMNRWAASGHGAITDMTALKPATATIPQYKGKDICLQWFLKGKCSTTCKRSESHKRFGTDTLKQIHDLMDACGVAQSE